MVFTATPDQRRAAAMATIDTHEPPAKKRRRSQKRILSKPSYVVLKEKKEALRKQIEALEAQAAALERTASDGVGHDTDDGGLHGVIGENQALRGILHQQQYAFAEAQSLFAEHVVDQRAYPLYSHIHLGRHWRERQRVMTMVKDHMVRSAYRYINDRGRHLDVLKEHSSDERFETSDGDFVCVRFDSTVLTGVESLRQVYDAMCCYFMNMEISISERLGHVTVREDNGLTEHNVYNYRLVSNDENGISTEANMVTVTQFFDDAATFGEPIGVMSSDCVDQDDRFPYNSVKHIRKDLTGSVLLTAHRRCRHDDGEAELVVVARRAVFLKLHRAQFPIDPAALEGVREDIARWEDVMFKSIRERLALQVKCGQ